MISTRRGTIEEFITKAQKVHGEQYDYSLVNYINNKTLVKIKCPIHGIFKQTPSQHINLKSTCQKCARLRAGEKNRKQAYSKEQFIDRAQAIHNNQYDYSLVDYINKKTPVIIICKIHGSFEQLPAVHCSGSGCPKCGMVAISKSQKYTLIQLKILFKKKHGNKYSYNLLNDIASLDHKIIILCKVHGQFILQARNHLRGSGCPQCSRSRGELAIQTFLEKNKIQYEMQKKFPQCVDKKELLFDFYLPIFNLCIEYDGLQHYKSINYYGGHLAFNDRKNKDKIKNMFCEQNSIRLLRIPYFQFKEIEIILKEQING